jgi:hypothetical protein
MEVYGVGRVLEWGEWWLLTYYACGHETRINRVSQRLFDPDQVAQLVLSDYAACIICHPPRRLV